MTITRLTSACALALLAACGGDGTNPLSGGGTNPEGGAGVGDNLSFNEGNELYTLQRVRMSGGDLVVEGLPFDGDDDYAATAIVLGPSAAFPQATVFAASPSTIDDSYDGGSDGPIFQDSYLAVFNEAASGNARVAVVRSGSYLEHGFGGYVVGRDVGVDMPTAGQANYNGNYAALRTFNGAGGIELVDGDMLIEVDFENLEDNGAMRGWVYNRTLYDQNGVAIGSLPELIMTVQAGGVEDNGQFETDIRTEYYGPDATQVSDLITEYGDVKGMFVGGNGQEIVGIVDITTANDFSPNGSVTIDGTTYTTYGFGDATTISDTRETGTFVLER